MEELQFFGTAFVTGLMLSVIILFYRGGGIKARIYHCITKEYGYDKWFTIAMLVEKGFPYGESIKMVNALLYLEFAVARDKATMQTIDYSYYVQLIESDEVGLETVEEVLTFYNSSEFRYAGNNGTKGKRKRKNRSVSDSLPVGLRPAFQ